MYTGNKRVFVLLTVFKCFEVFGRAFGSKLQFSRF